jgi:serpin B
MRVRFFLALSLILVCCAILAGCVSGPGPENKPVFPAATITAEPHLMETNAPPTATDEENAVIAANNQFAFDLYKKLKNDPDNSQKNIVFSPLSISSVMAIVGEGARGKTADEIQTVFHFPEDTTILHQGYSGLIGTIGAGNDKDTTLLLANALWAEKTYPFLPEYMQTAEQYYNATATSLDIENDPDGSLDTINRWVEEKTKGKITNLLSREDIDPQSTRLLITNSLYFSGTWVKKFGDSSMGKFRVSPNETVEVPMMFRSIFADFNYAEFPDMQVIELLYRNSTGHQNSMLVILPKDDDLQEVENSLDTEKLEQIRQSLEYQELAYIMFPKFSTESRYTLPETLKSMGMPRAFSLVADFSGMDGMRENLYIDDVIHKTFIDVNEDGTQAAASTVGSMKSQGGSHGNPPFVADHPFIFIIQDRDNGAILFMGRVMDPTAG